MSSPRRPTSTGPMLRATVPARPTVSEMRVPRHHPRVAEEPPRAHEQHQAEVPPAVGPGPQVRGTVAPVGAERHGDLLDAQAVRRCDHDHLRGPLHAAGAEAEASDRDGAEPAEPAVHVPDAEPEQAASEPRERRVPDAPVEPWHRTGLDAAAEPVPDDDIGPCGQTIEHRIESTEVVRAVRIGHDREGAAGVPDADVERVPVARIAGLHDPCAGRRSQLRGAVHRTVVDDEDLAIDVPPPEETARSRDARGDGRRLVTAGEQDGEEDGCVHVGSIAGG